MESHEVARIWLDGKLIRFDQPTTLHVGEDRSWRLEATLPDDGPLRQMHVVSALRADGAVLRGQGRIVPLDGDGLVDIVGEDADLSTPGA